MSSCQVCSKSMGFLGIGAKKVIVLEGRAELLRTSALNVTLHLLSNDV